MGVTKFRIKSRRLNRQYISLNCTYFDVSSGTHYTLFTDGKIVNRPPLNEELFHKSVLNVPITQSYKEGDDRVLYQDFEFYDESDMKDMSIEKQKQSKRNRRLYDFIMQGHDNFIIMKNGENINSNAHANPQFELINLTEQTKVEERFNKDFAEASMRLKYMYDHSQEDFIEFCYAYGIPITSTATAATLYNLCAVKLQNNPAYFLEMAEHKDRQVIALVNRALNQAVEDSNGNKSTPLVLRSDGTVFFNELPIGNGIDQCVEYFKIHDTERRALEARLGVRNSFTKGIKLMKDSDIANLSLSTPQEKADAKEAINTEATLIKMRSEIDAAYSKYKTATRRDDKISELRDKYQDYLMAFDAYVENIMATKSSNVPQAHNIQDNFVE
jgi:hypothetical protein